ncbi:MAG: aspartyl-phosphate phosphatase Spo0E family protein [Clostridiaceae bacterium]|nr:aspartyl-phosphate phosphatase Spo0E family protein [Clostridiaceae bacterium]
MMEKEKIAQLKKEIKLLREKLGETISKENDYINAGKALRISKELDELIVEYYNCSSSGKSS